MNRRGVLVLAAAAGIFAAAARPAGGVESVSEGLLWPLEASRSLTGAFGEFRSGHPHAGVDLSTFGRTGFPVRAPASGWIYKIRHSRYGYGNVIYVRLDAGGFLVFGHLQRFSDRLERLFEGHPADEEGRVEVIPPEGRVRIERGEVVAFTGESGAGLPHLHFELRDGDERPLNPLTRGAVLEDREAPVVHSVIIEPAGPEGRVEGVPGPVEFVGRRTAPVRVRPPVRVLASASDGDGRRRGRLGLRSVRLLVDGREAFAFQADRFSYPRQAESDLAYDAYRSGGGRYVHRLFDAGGTHEMTSPTPAAIIDGPPGRRTITVEASDAAGNAASVRIPIEVLAPDSPSPAPTTPGLFPMDGWIGVVRPGLPAAAEAHPLAPLPVGPNRVAAAGGDFVFGLGRVTPARGGEAATVDGEARLVVGEGAAYAPAEIVAAAKSLPADARLPVVRGPYAFHPLGLAFDRPVRISFRAPALVARPEQLGIYRWDAVRRRWAFEDDERPPGRIEAEVSSLAPFALLRDAVAPRIVASTPGDGRRVARADRITVTLADAGSGVDPRTVQALLDGRALPGWFDPDHSWFIHDGPVPPGRHRLEIEARDSAENAVRGVVSFEVGR